MPPEAPENGIPTPPSPPRSKQERIRDNQRRSRARRQEYLAGLEKRWSKCQTACRDADIQRAAFIELQIENTRLRELLSLAGVNGQFVEHYVCRAVAQGTQSSQEATPALRQLKPKIAAIDPNIARSSNAGGSHLTNILQPTFASVPPRRHSHNVMSPTPVASIPDQDLALAPTSSYNTVSPIMPSLSDMSSQANLDWLCRQSPLLQAQNPHEPSLCDASGVPARRPPRTAGDSTVLCSVPKQAMDQYYKPPQETEPVKTEISRGCFRPSFPSAGCTVDNQVLFQVLHELSAKYP